MKQLTVMVTGAGAVLGQGILRCLRMSHRKIRIITADPDFRAAGHWLGDYAVLIPMANEPKFLIAVEKILEREKIDICFVGTDVELQIFSKERIRFEKMYGTKVIVSSPQVVEIANDKLLTAKFLEDAGFPFARSASADDRRAVEKLIITDGFPLIVKPKQGARSVGVYIVNNQDDLAAAIGRADLMVQEFLPENEGEFTAGCIVLDNKCVSTIILKRDLRDGNTYRAYAEMSNRFDKKIAKIAEKLECNGPCNFQFRIKNGRPIIFEINARFSGTTPIRAIFGFNEVIAIIDYLCDGIPISEVNLKEGAVFRTWSDIYVDSSQLDEFKINRNLVKPSCSEYPFRLL